MSAPHVTVRMYKGLLGDCFLLRLFTGDAPDRSRPADAHVLIDCGILQGAPGASKRMSRVVDDITKIGTLDLVVVTHEHYDHICGFKDLLNKSIGIKELWLAWTENPEDELAQELRKIQDETRMAIAAGIQHMAICAEDRPGGSEPRRDWVLDGAAMGLDSFIGPLAASASGTMTSREILEGLKGTATSTRYCEPGNVLPLPCAEDIRVFVLGPPKNMARLMKDRPSSSPKNRETYLDKRMDEAKLVVRNFVGAADAPEVKGAPFSKRFCKISDRILFGNGPTKPRRGLPRARNVWDICQKYRLTPEEIRIDDDWHSPVGNLALKLDSDTNNTSLVLAFELGGPSGAVLLFAADAQVGNWLSWHDQKYPSGKDPVTQEVTPDDIGETATEILSRVVLYKVGLHGSHNATLSKDGLEQMGSNNLVALLPVVEEVAAKRGWKMPYDKMFDRLKELTKDRILRGDAPVGGKVFDRDVREAAGNDPDLGPLWVEYDVS